MSNANVVIFSGNHCPACIKAKEFFSELGIKYIERNIDENEQAEKDMAELGSESLPTIVVNNKVIVGFSTLRKL